MRYNSVNLLALGSTLFESTSVKGDYPNISRIVFVSNFFFPCSDHADEIDIVRRMIFFEFLEGYSNLLVTPKEYIL